MVCPFILFPLLRDIYFYFSQEGNLIFINNEKPTYRPLLNRYAKRGNPSLHDH